MLICEKNFVILHTVFQRLENTMNFEKRIKDKQEGKVHLSKKGSIIFYVFLLCILLFFIVMYIKYRMLYA